MRIASDYDFGGGTRAAGTYVVAYTRDGSYMWDREFPIVQDIEAAPDGIIVGGFFGPSFDFGGGVRSAPGSSVFVARYGLDGTYVWDHAMTSDTFVRVADVSYRDGVIGLAGKFAGATTFAEGEMRVGAGTGDTWALTLRDATPPSILSLFVSTGTADDEALAIAAEADRTYVCGRYATAGQVDFGAGPAPSDGTAYRAFVLELDAAGAHLAERTWGDPAGGNATCAALAREESGHLLVAGNFTGTVDFGGGSRSGGGIFLARYGEGLSHRSDSVIPAGELRAAEVGPADSTVLVGSVSGTVDLGSGPRTSAGSVDGFIVRLAR